MAFRFRATSFGRLAPIARLGLDRERVVSEYWYLCRRAARRFVRRGVDRADLEQIAAIGLIKAADRYDRGQTAPFEAYAWVLVLGELMHYVRDGERLVRAPRGLRELAGRWSTAETKLWLLLGREPSENDVAKFIGASEADVREVVAYRASDHMISFDLLGSAEQRIPPDGIDDVVDRVTVESILAALSPLERQIVRSIHLEDIPVVELARRLGYSRRHVTRLHRGALERLKSSYWASEA